MDESEQVGALRRKLERFLDEISGGSQVDPEGDFVVALGSAQVWIRPFEVPGGRAFVRIWTITNVDVTVDDELTRFIATENGRLDFGVLQLAEDQPVIGVGHTLLGEFLNRKELETAVVAVGETGDRYDDLIKSRFGGRLFTEPG